MISIILPTYNEVDNIKLIVPSLFEVLEREGIHGEIIVVDDNSPDGTASAAQKLGEKYPVKVRVRKGQRDLSKAVLEGFELAEGEICVVMDADLSHPVEKLPDMVRPILENECDATVGTRNVKGGGCKNWPLIRRIISKGAGMLAFGITELSDPTSGFMAIRKELVHKINVDPVGWKIVLEIIVKTQPRLLEVPIVFADRKGGKSKLGLRIQIYYLKHLWKLYNYRHPRKIQFVKFCLVGMSGVIVDTAVLISLVDLVSFDPRFAAIFAFLAAVTWNYIFDRTWTFDFRKKARTRSSYFFFVLVCIIGLCLRIVVMHFLIEAFGMGEGHWYIIASLAGISIATVFNFFGSKYIAFA